MAVVDYEILEMPDDETIGAMPPYDRLIEWVTKEVEGLTDEQRLSPTTALLGRHQ